MGDPVIGDQKKDETLENRKIITKDAKEVDLLIVIIKVDVNEVDLHINLTIATVDPKVDPDQQIETEAREGIVKDQEIANKREIDLDLGLEDDVNEAAKENVQDLEKNTIKEKSLVLLLLLQNLINLEIPPHLEDRNGSKTSHPPQMIEI